MRKPLQTKPQSVPSPQPESDRVLERLMRLHPKVIDLSLDRIERLLALLGHPQDALPPVLHVAGTNGKGSLIAYLRAMLEAAGKRVHVYTSPHLVRFHERIRLAGAVIDEDRLVSLLEECEAVNGETPITFFEVTTAAAFLAFAREPADILLLETGLGGRLDATNMIAQPHLTALTPISIDHTQFLGETLAEIAGEKAGILKPEVTVVVGPQVQEALEVILDRAEAIGAPLCCHGRDWYSEGTEAGFAYTDETGTTNFDAPGLLGAFQSENAALAVAVARQLSDFDLDLAAQRRGLAEVRWPGRLQQIHRGALRDHLPKDWALWLDGGHNASAGEALAQSLEAWQDRPLHLVIGMLNTKAAGDYLRPLRRFAATLHCVAIPGEVNAFSAEDLTAEAAKAGLHAQPAESLGAALTDIAETASNGPARVLICGSLYFAGRALQQNGDPG